MVVGVGGGDVEVGGTGDGGISVGATVSSAAHALSIMMPKMRSITTNTDRQNADLPLKPLLDFFIDILLLLFFCLQLAELEGEHQGDGSRILIHQFSGNLEF